MADLSILIPVYGVERYIERCAEALFRQTLKEGVEFIFVDDASPDRSIALLEDVVRRYPRRIPQTRIIRHDANRGVAAARLTALNAAKGEYIIYSDSDDWTDPEMFETMLLEAKRCYADVVSCDYMGEFPGKSIYYTQNPGENIIDYRCRLIRGNLHNCLWNKMIRHEIVNAIDKPFTEGHNHWEDVALTCRVLAIADNYVHIARPFYHYFQGNAAAYTRNVSAASIENMIRSCNIVRDFYGSRQDAECYAEALRMLCGRTLYSALCHSDKSAYTELRKRLDPQNILRGNDIPAGKADRIAFSLMLSGHYAPAKAILKLKTTARRLLR